MEGDEYNHRLSRITTEWTLVARAHSGTEPALPAAQQALLQRYAGAIYRYLLAALRDPDAAEEVAQEFAYRLVRGDFKQADPRRGRFRDFLKTVLFHLIADYQRQRQKRARQVPLPPDEMGPAARQENPDEQEFLERWRDELLDRTWEALEAFQKEGGGSFYTVLRFRAEHPGLSSAQMALQLGARLGRPLTDRGVRQTLHRAREKYAALLLDEVARSLQTSDPEQVRQELSDLGLAAYCRPALARHTPAPEGRK